MAKHHKVSHAKMHRGDGGMHITSIKSDGMAHSSHTAANKKHGMPDGFGPGEGYEGTEHVKDSGMGCNTCGENEPGDD